MSDALGYHRSCVVMSHDVLWSNHNIVACLDDLSLWETDSIFLNDLLNHRLGYWRCPGGDRRKLSLRAEH